ncbi:hypothetical protein MY11210_000913 [Beauveria gryllotalpidicola]
MPEANILRRKTSNKSSGLRQPTEYIICFVTMQPSAPVGAAPSAHSLSVRLGTHKATVM